MERKLTLADCFKYPNAKIKTPNRQRPDELIGLIYWMQECVIDDEELGESKLQLRKVESMTEEEKQKVIEIMRFYNDKMERIDSGLDCFACGDYYKDKYDFLRSVSIDIDDFIEAGIAEEQQ